MGILARDTVRSAEKVQVEVLKTLPAWKRLKLLDETCQTTRTVMMAGLRSRFPEVPEAEIQRMLMDLLLGKETAERIWGPRVRSDR
jgi:hypothetical protein